MSERPQILIEVRKGTAANKCSRNSMSPKGPDPTLPLAKPTCYASLHSYETLLSLSRAHFSKVSGEKCLLPRTPISWLVCITAHDPIRQELEVIHGDEVVPQGPPPVISPSPAIRSRILSCTTRVSFCRSYAFFSLWSLQHEHTPQNNMNATHRCASHPCLGTTEIAVRKSATW